MLYSLRMKKTSPHSVVDHVSRLEGQLASIKKELMTEAPDCAKVSQTLLSASRSFAGLREQCIENFLLHHFVEKKKNHDEVLFKQLLAVVKG